MGRVCDLLFSLRFPRFLFSSTFILFAFIFIFFFLFCASIFHLIFRPRWIRFEQWGVLCAPPCRYHKSSDKTQWTHEIVAKPSAHLHTTIYFAVGGMSCRCAMSIPCPSVEFRFDDFFFVLFFQFGPPFWLWSLNRLWWLWPIRCGWERKGVVLSSTYWYDGDDGSCQVVSILRLGDDYMLVECLLWNRGFSWYKKKAKNKTDDKLEWVQWTNIK